MQTETKVIEGQPIHNWQPDGKMYHWPEGIVVKMPNGEEWDIDGGYDADGTSIDDNPSKITVGGSPCHAAMVAANIELAECCDG